MEADKRGVRTGETLAGTHHDGGIEVALLNLEARGGAEGATCSAHTPVPGKELEACPHTGPPDAPSFRLYAGIPSLVYGPTARNIHAFDEKVDLESMRRVTQTIALFIADWCGTEEI